MRYEHAILDLATAAPDALGAVAALADACGGRYTTAVRLRGALAERTWSPRRDFLGGVLDDVATGACSVLERGYLTEVVRPHGLPEGVLQTAVTRGTRRMYRDVLIEEQRLLVELDGRLFHSSRRAREVDLDRDLSNAVERGELTVRLGYDQVFSRPCATARQLSTLLRRRGWAGPGHGCGRCAPAA